MSCKTEIKEKSSAEFLKEHIEWFAAEEREGRLAGSMQEAAAANYISDLYLQFGLLPVVDMETYIQQFVLSGPMVQVMQMENHISRNVVGAVPGREYPDRYIILGAHYDGQGLGGMISMDMNNEPSIHNSADDNASGTSGLLWLASRFAENPAKSTIIFAAFSGEEMGLLGSRHFTDEMTMPHDSVMAMINMDMIGRLNDGQLSIIGTGTANIWDDILEKIPADSLQITRTPGGMSSSDHASFSRAGIPVLHYFTGNHEDYHRASDTANKINYQGMEWVLDHVEKTVRLLDDYNPSDIEFSESTDPRSTSMLREGVSLGVIPDYNYSGTGFRIDSVRSGSKAENAGIRDGDVIIRIDEQNISDIYDYMQSLNNLGEGDEAAIRVLRNGDEVELVVHF